MPSTALLLTRSDTLVVGRFSNYTEVGHHLGISIDDDGKITFRGREVNPTYRLVPDDNGFTKTDAIRDWCRCHMHNNLGDYRVYRYLA
jgi:hypothetical protein